MPTSWPYRSPLAKRTILLSSSICSIRLFKAYLTAVDTSPLEKVSFLLPNLYKCFNTIYNISFRRSGLNLDLLFSHCVSNICNNVTMVQYWDWHGYEGKHSFNIVTGVCIVYTLLCFLFIFTYVNTLIQVHCVIFT